MDLEKNSKLKNLLLLFSAFFKIGLFTFGGGLSMLPMLEKECIEKNKWVTKDELSNYFAISGITPGIIAVNTATFIGYKFYGFLGALFTTLGVISPSIIVISIFSHFITKYSNLIYLNYAFNGIRVIVICLLINSLISLIKNNIKDKFGVVLFLLTFVLATFAKLSFTIIVLIFGIIGLIYYSKVKKDD